MSYAVEIQNISKRYYLGKFGYQSFQGDLKRYARRLLKPYSADRYEREKKESEFFALKDVCLQIRPGERVGVIGDNGAGKSTLLKILSRVTLPTAGQVRMRGKVASLLEVGTGFHPELTGRENIFLNGAIMGMSRAEIRGRLDEIIDFSGIERFIDTPVKRYSSGMYVRLAFAVAAHLEPDILILDEVLAVGDANFQKKCLGKMESVAKEDGRTVIFVSHAMGAVASLCDRAVQLKNGVLVADGRPKETISKYLNDVVKSEARVSFGLDHTKEAQIVEVALMDEAGHACSTLDINRPFTVEIAYQVNSPLVGAVLNAALFPEGQDCLISTADYDLDRSKLDLRVPGIYKTSVSFPGQIFNSGSFSLVVGLSIPGKAIFDRREALKFELIDGGSFMANGGGEIRRAAALLMPLRWKDLEQKEF